MLKNTASSPRFFPSAKSSRVCPAEKFHEDPFTLSALPAEVKCHIPQFLLDRKDLLSLLQVSTEWRDVVKQSCLDIRILPLFPFMEQQHKLLQTAITNYKNRERLTLYNPKKVFRRNGICNHISGAALIILLLLVYLIQIVQPLGVNVMIFTATLFISGFSLAIYVALKYCIEYESINRLLDDINRQEIAEMYHATSLLQLAEDLIKEVLGNPQSKERDYFKLLMFFNASVIIVLQKFKIYHENMHKNHVVKIDLDAINKCYIHINPRGKIPEFNTYILNTEGDDASLTFQELPEKCYNPQTSQPEPTTIKIADIEGLQEAIDLGDTYHVRELIEGHHQDKPEIKTALQPKILKFLIKQWNERSENAKEQVPYTTTTTPSFSI